MKSMVLEGKQSDTIHWIDVLTKISCPHFFVVVNRTESRFSFKSGSDKSICIERVKSWPWVQIPVLKTDKHKDLVVNI
jgi:hypothetical protein